MAVRYQVVTSFIFLRFFTAAIMGPNLFDLYSDTLEPCVQRTLTLISKGISGLVSLVSSKSNNMTTKEEYMGPLFEMFPPFLQTEIKMFLDIISSSSGSHVKVIEAPIILKEGYLIKRAQGRKRFGILNFKKRYFQLTNQSLSYYKNKGDKHVLYQIPIAEILAVEKLEEECFKMKYMLQVIHVHRALYIQASNCVEEKEWLDILTKVCKSNQNRLKFYHPAAFVTNHWLCCKLTDPTMPGCKPVTGGLPLDDILEDIDSDREVEKIHSLLLSAVELLYDLQGFGDEDVFYETCGSQVVYSGEAEVRSNGLGSNIEDPASCFSTIAEIQHCIMTLEQEHLQYMQFLHSRTIVGSVDSPIGDGSSTDLVRNINRTSERLSRRGSKSSNASSMSRQSFRAGCSRGSSFQERGKVSALIGNGVKRSQSGEFHHQTTPTAPSLDVVPADTTKDDDRRPRNTSGDSRKVRMPTPISNLVSLIQASDSPPDSVHPYNALHLSFSNHTQSAAEYLSTNSGIDNIIIDITAINNFIQQTEQSSSACDSEAADDTLCAVEPTTQDIPERVPGRPACCKSPEVTLGQQNGENCQVLMMYPPAGESVGDVDVKSSPTVDAQTDWTDDVDSAKTVDVESFRTVCVEQFSTDDMQTAKTFNIDMFPTVSVDAKLVIDSFKKHATEEHIQHWSPQTSRDLTPHIVCCHDRQEPVALDDDVLLLTSSDITSPATFCENLQPSEKPHLLTEADTNTVPGIILTTAEIQQDISSPSNYNQVISSWPEHEHSGPATDSTSSSAACVPSDIGQAHDVNNICSPARDMVGVSLESYHTDTTRASTQRSVSLNVTGSGHFVPSVFPVGAMCASGEADLSQDACNQMVIFI